MADANARRAASNKRATKSGPAAHLFDAPLRSRRDQSENAGSHEEERPGLNSDLVGSTPEDRRRGSVGTDDVARTVWVRQAPARVPLSADEAFVAGAQARRDHHLKTKDVLCHP